MRSSSVEDRGHCKNESSAHEIWPASKGDLHNLVFTQISVMDLWDPHGSWSKISGMEVQRPGKMYEETLKTAIGFASGLLHFGGGKGLDSSVVNEVKRNNHYSMPIKLYNLVVLAPEDLRRLKSTIVTEQR